MQKLRLKMRPGCLPRLFAIFQQGILLRVEPGSSMGEVLDAAGFSRGYLEERVQTIFLDGSSVDDVDDAAVKGGSVIALSAAMPGLVGAIFRKGSPVSALRSRTSQGKSARGACGETQQARLKLFNIVAEEMGPALLDAGVILPGRDLGNFFSGRRELLKDAVVEVALDGELIDPGALFVQDLFRSEHVLLVARS